MSRQIRDKTIRWGIIGAGGVCEVKSGPALQLANDSELVAVMRRNAELAKDFARRHNVPRWYGDADELINDAGVNAIYVATPPGTHCEMTIKAASAGKAVYVEKPMARTSAECDAMIEACEAAGVPLYVAYYRRALPNFLKIRELLKAGKIGDVRYVRIELNQRPSPLLVRAGDPDWRVVPEVSGGGYFYDLASHQLDFLDFALGPIVSASGRASNQAGLYTAEDIVSGTFQFASGVMGSGVWCFTSSASSERDKTTIVGSRGEIRYATFAGDTTRVELETDADGLATFDYNMPRHIQQGLIQTVVDELLGRGECPSTGVSGARTNRVLERICRR